MSGLTKASFTPWHMVDHIKAQLAAAGAKLPPEPKKNAPKPRTPVVSTVTPPKPPESIVEAVIIEDTTPPPTVAETHYIGRYQLNVVNGTHYPGRMRAVLVGPADADLIKCLTAALSNYTSTP